MKLAKKISALMIAGMLTVASVVPAMASETVTNTAINTGSFSITVNKDSTDKAAHTYGAFQIFKGDLAETTVGGQVTSKVLSNIEWGNNIDTTKVATLIGSINTILGLTGNDVLAADASAAKVAEAIGKKSLAADAAEAQALAEAFDAALTGNPAQTASVAADGTSATIAGLNAGYYLVKDTADVTGEGAFTRFIMQVVSDVTTAEKANVPTVEKFTDDKNDSNTGEDEISWGKTADYDVNDVIPYKIVGTLPTNYADYEVYSYQFTDTMSAGLTYNSNAKVVLFASKADALAATSADDTKGTDISTLFTVNSAVIDDTTKETTLTLGCPVVKDGENYTKKGLKDNASITADSAIVVFYTATLNSDAVIGNAGNPNTVDLEFSNNSNKGGEGETGKTPEDKNIVFTLKTVVNKVDGQNKPLTGATFKLYKKYVSAEAVTAAGKTAATKPTVTPTAMTDAEWAALVKDGQVLVDVGEAVLNEGGTTFTFNRLDDGDYVLIETNTPAGYNSADPYPFTITASHDLTGIIDLTSTGNTTDKDAGSVSTDVINNQGSTLPSTGGIGTTIFYVGGAILVILAAIVLVSKRRMAE